ncbi:hypothetical protein ACIQX3_05995 [Peribacillus frigoritolerans]|uniref:hypothetical protein n=1 Tax=Peribacillus frigoritolerans TaxID=450367 RepID=UPI0038100C23
MSEKENRSYSELESHLNSVSYKKQTTRPIPHITPSPYTKDLFERSEKALNTLRKLRMEVLRQQD